MNSQQQKTPLLSRENQLRRCKYLGRREVVRQARLHNQPVPAFNLVVYR